MSWGDPGMLWTGMGAAMGDPTHMATAIETAVMRERR
jgi:hypothetical protein